MNSTNLNKKELLLQKLNEVEQRNLDWFKQRPAVFDQLQHDSLRFHTFSEGEGDAVSLNFWKHSELPEKIKAECLKAYEEVFGKKLVD